MSVCVGADVQMCWRTYNMHLAARLKEQTTLSFHKRLEKLFKSSNGFGCSIKDQALCFEKPVTERKGRKTLLL